MVGSPIVSWIILLFLAHSYFGFSTDFEPVIGALFTCHELRVGYWVWPSVHFILHSECFKLYFTTYFVDFDLGPYLVIERLFLSAKN